MTEPKRKLDMVVKLALGVFFGSFILIGIGMFLTRPDRSIPPYSVGSQEGTTVFVHVPSWTPDSRIETLIRRFRKVGRGTGDFGPLKIRPTTPDDPGGRYQRIAIYVFTAATWAEPEKLHQYLTTKDPEVKRTFEKAVRGLYRLDESGEEGRIGPILAGKDTAATAAYARELFKGPLTAPLEAPFENGPDATREAEPTAGLDRLPEQGRPLGTGPSATSDGPGGPDR